MEKDNFEKTFGEFGKGLDGLEFPPFDFSFGEPLVKPVQKKEDSADKLRRAFEDLEARMTPMQKGRRDENKGNLEKAMKFYRSVADKTNVPTQADAAIARVYQKQGRIDDCLKYLKHTISVPAPSNVAIMGYKRLGRMVSKALRDMNYLLAQEACQVVVDRNENNVNALHAYNAMGHIATKMGQIELARTWYLRVAQRTAYSKKEQAAIDKARARLAPLYQKL